MVSRNRASKSKAKKLRAVGAIISLLVAATLGGCVTSGQPFDGGRVAEMQPGRSSFSDALLVLGAPPVEIYRERFGQYTARWSSKRSMVNDGVYLRQSLTLAFGADDKLIRLVDSVHVPLDAWARIRLLGVASSKAETHGHSSVPNTSVQ